MDILIVRRFPLKKKWFNGEIGIMEQNWVWILDGILEQEL